MQELRVDSELQGGKYRIVKKLGQGGFGITYEGVQTGLERRVAIKEFFMKDYCNRNADTSQVTIGSEGSREMVDDYRRKFLKEAQLIARMEDVKGVVRIHDIFEENQTAYYVMEFIPGGSLKQLVEQRGRLPEDEAVGYVRQVGQALQQLHSQSILHLDVKPDNILLNRQGEAVLIDFGVSKHYDKGGSQTSSTPVGLSKGFAPSEQYQQDGVNRFSPATDVYSLGATLFYLLTATAPPDANLVFEDGLPARPEYISLPVWQAIEQAMQPRKKDRTQTVVAFMQGLLPSPVDSVHGTGAAAASATPDSRPTRPATVSQPLSSETSSASVSTRISDAKSVETQLSDVASSKEKSADYIGLSFIVASCATLLDIILLMIKFDRYFYDYDSYYPLHSLYVFSVPIVWIVSYCAMALFGRMRKNTPVCKKDYYLAAIVAVLVLVSASIVQSSRLGGFFFDVVIYHLGFYVYGGLMMIVICLSFSYMPVCAKVAANYQKWWMVSNVLVGLGLFYVYAVAVKTILNDCLANIMFAENILRGMFIFSVSLFAIFTIWLKYRQKPVAGQSMMSQMLVSLSFVALCAGFFAYFLTYFRYYFSGLL